MVRARDHTSAKDAQHLASWEVNPPMHQRGGVIKVEPERKPPLSL